MSMKSLIERLKQQPKTVDALRDEQRRGWQAAVEELREDGVLAPQPHGPLCRYRLPKPGIEIDLVQANGANAGGANRWLRAAVDRSRLFAAGDGSMVRAVTPPYFLLLKLEALADPARRRDPETGVDLGVDHHDAEDIVSLFIEVGSLVDDLRGAGLFDDAARAMQHVLRELKIRDVADWVTLWIGDADLDGVVAAFQALAATSLPDE